MRVWPLFAALHVIRNDTGKYGATWVGITRLRHKSRHKIWRWRLAAIRPVVCGVADPPPFRTRAGRVQKNLEKIATEDAWCRGEFRDSKTQGHPFWGSGVYRRQNAPFPCLGGRNGAYLLV